MRLSDAGELVLLAAIWGASFLFMKLGAGEFGAIALAAVRVLLAAAVLLPLVLWRGQWPVLRQRAGQIALVGVINSALPFAGFAYAALSITAGAASVLNACAPLWAAIVAWAWLGERPDRWRSLGLLLGFAGVLWLAWDKVGAKSGRDALQVLLAVLACLGATLCYGWAVNHTRQRLAGVPPLTLAAGSQLAAALALAGPALVLWPARTPSPQAWWAVLALGVLCTALAYLLYFRLIAHLGPSRAITVTYLIPLFGVAWGLAFLDESLSPGMLGAAGVILLGTAMASGLVAPGRRRAAAAPTPGR